MIRYPFEGWFAHGSGLHTRPAGPPWDHGWQADHRAGALPAVRHAVIERRLRPLPSTITQGCDNYGCRHLGVRSPARRDSSAMLHRSCWRMRINLSSGSISSPRRRMYSSAGSWGSRGNRSARNWRMVFVRSVVTVITSAIGRPLCYQDDYHGENKNPAGDIRRTGSRSRRFSWIYNAAAITTNRRRTYRIKCNRHRCESQCGSRKAVTFLPETPQLHPRDLSHQAFTPNPE